MGPSQLGRHCDRLAQPNEQAIEVIDKGIPSKHIRVAMVNGGQAEDETIWCSSFVDGVPLIEGVPSRI